MYPRALEAMKIYRPTVEGFTRVGELSVEAGDELTTPLLPGVDQAIR